LTLIRNSQNDKPILFIVSWLQLGNALVLQAPACGDVKLGLHNETAKKEGCMKIIKRELF
jgi:hypothetical protein